MRRSRESREKDHGKGKLGGMGKEDRGLWQGEEREINKKGDSL